MTVRERMIGILQNELKLNEKSLEYNLTRLKNCDTIKSQDEVKKMIVSLFENRDDIIKSLELFGAN